MDLQRAQTIAENITERLSPYCRIQVAGSVRRKKPAVKDIDFVLIPSDPWNLNQVIKGLGTMKAGGDKLKRLIVAGVQVDLYFATEETWATLFLIRTGSAQNNIRLATLAKKKGWQLKANGDGLFDDHGQRIAGDTEESIFEALGIPYQRPEERT